MIELKEIVKTYKSSRNLIYALKGINLKIESGEYLMISGRSGSGKSTLLSIIAGLTKPQSGCVYYNNKDITNIPSGQVDDFRREHIGFILQSYSLLNDRNVYANIELPLKLKKKLKADREEKIVKLLKKLEIDDKRFSYPNQLSGGQQQRVAIARALADDREIILADEPTEALDRENAINIAEALRKLSDEGKTVIMATHNTEFASFCDRHITIDSGEIISVK